MQPSLLAPVGQFRTAPRHDDVLSTETYEQTPLLGLTNLGSSPQTSATILAVGTLITILLLGLVIGVYLLVVQSDSENVLPPIDPLDIVPVTEWYIKDISPSTNKSEEVTEAVIVVATGTEECNTVVQCSQLIQELQVNNTKLSYNFLVSSTGVVLEAFGWQRSPVFSELSVLVIACIGNFNQSAPTHIQVESVARLAAYAVSSGHLVPGYSVLVGTGMPQPPRLLQRLLLLPTWKNKMSYKVYD
ncbi:peptidoglycan recognition protein 4-like isoform X5 [Leptidea sinapis]|uniref:peptidoglycan recognition protein 4-like isoform X5 n=1 Tax=Leptidea sinapis TaxID=189913 RepID=UPI00212E2E84|nr:peptidoglycan recognition protein 4-like isoform X5 [Leptidea sinapis]XP_050683321.1 peptidoglycan recognition protein 4-like isoform X5 [Leptidea sinapis]